MTVKLSICIATYNRAQLLRETIDSIIPQLTSECEIVISDNASTDDTEQVVSEYSRQISCLKYHRQDTNKGLDRNFDSAVELASGEYCWLFADDDVLKPDAIATVLSAIRRNFSLVLVNWEGRDSTLSQVLIPYNFAGPTEDKIYTPDQIDELFDKSDSFIFIGCVIINRSVWLSRERSRYYGSLIVHIGVIFQDRLPGDTLIIAKVCVSFRENYNKTFLGPELFEAQVVKWPAVVTSLAVSDAAKQRKIADRLKPSRLLLDRAVGLYSLVEYRRCIAPKNLSFQKRALYMLIAAIPSTALNALYILYYRWLSRRPTQQAFVRWLRHSDANLLKRWQLLKTRRHHIEQALYKADS